MSMEWDYRGWLLPSCGIAPTYLRQKMRIPCPACTTENASDATVCIHCAAVLSPPSTVFQRMSLLEQAMAKPAAMPFAKPAVPPAAPIGPSPAPSPTPVAAAKQPAPSATAHLAAPAMAKPPNTMPPLPRQPRARRRRRTPWILAAVLLLALLGALAYEQLQIHGVSLRSLSLPSVWTARH